MRNKSIKIRVSEDELAQLQAKKGRAELARWLREVGLSESSGKQHVVKHELPPEVVRILAGIGANLNQVARTLNTQAKQGSLDVRLCATDLLVELVATERALTAIREFLKNDS